MSNSSKLEARKSTRSTSRAGSGPESRRQLLLLQDLALKVNEARSAREALQFAVRLIWSHDAWDVGHAFLLRTRPDSRLIPSPSHWRCAASQRFANFRRVTLRSGFEIGQGMVGKVARTRRPRWIEDVAEASPPIRAEDPGSGLESGLLIPVVVRSEPGAIAVLEFYSSVRRRANPAQLRVAVSVGALLGRVFEREQFERHLAQSRENEQQRIGRELHDTVSQELTGITMMGERLSEQLDADADSAVARRLRTLVGHLSRVRSQVHALSRGLLPVDIGAGGLRQALVYLADNVRLLHGLDCSVTYEETVRIDDTAVANHLARIAQEAIQNAAKHAEAERIQVSLAHVGPRIVLEVSDDGIGLAPKGRRKDGLGLRLMHHRASTIGAELKVISTRARRGTRVRCEWQP